MNPEFERYEEVLKSLDVAARIAGEAKAAAWEIEDKARFDRLRRDLAEARRLCRLNYYEYQDAAQIVTEANQL